jgi:pyruvate,water dikinase
MESVLPVVVGVDAGSPAQTRLAISLDLANARDYLAHAKRPEAAELAGRAAARILGLLARGVEPGDPLLSYYYFARLMKKFEAVPNNMGDAPVFRRKAVQVLAFDSTNTQVLLQRRGVFKRQFAGCDSVSASEKRKDGETATACGSRAVRREIEFDPDDHRFEVVGQENAFETHLTCVSFLSLSGEEEEALRRVAAKPGFANGIAVHYYPQARSLFVYTIDPSIGREKTIAVADEIRATTGIPYIFGFSNTDDNSLLVYRLSSEEESFVKALMARKAQAKRAASECAAEGLDEQGLLDLDADDMHFEPWIKARCESRTDPERFALPLTAPYFPHDEVWSAMGFTVPEVLDVSEPMASLACLAGGKAANSHVLSSLARDWGAFHAPPAVVLTTAVFESVVLTAPEIRAEIAALDREVNSEALGLRAARARSAILALRLPETLVSAVAAQFSRLGSDVAVRSSATFEDTEKYSAAGQADTTLHQITLAAVLDSIRQVWASLFADGFILYRNKANQLHSRARMAVLMQSFVHSEVSGVVFSFDPQSERPGYLISAQPGLGEGVVQGNGKADQWLVGLLCDSILERWIRVKRERIVPQPGGGIGRERIEMTSPSLSDDAVLRVADVARRVHENLVAMGLLEEIDIEYAVDGFGRIHALQARSKPSQRVVRASGELLIWVTAVDSAGLPAGVRKIQLDQDSLIAVEGAATGVLQIDDKRDAAACRPGAILVANQTSNDYNLVFGSLAAVITTDGNLTSHAAQHAYEKRIPCVVGSTGAMEQLALLDGKLVTFDAGARAVYEGAVPTVLEKRSLGLWLFDRNRICSFSDEGSRHENHRPWWDSKKKRPVIFMEDFEGHFRRRSNRYCYFQLDYFYKAWDYVNDFLTHAFGARTQQVLKPQRRLIKALDCRHQLVHDVADDDPGSIYYYLRSVQDFGITDLEWLFENRLERFRKFGEFVRGLKRIDESNAEALVDNILDVFVGMHFGFWLDAVAEDFAAHQFKYISERASFHNILRDEAIAEEERTFKVDPLNPGIPAGKVLNLSRERDKEIYALTEEIRSSAGLRGVFEAGDSALVRAGLLDRYPEILRVIDGWSMKYKLTLEDLDVLSDTDEYICALQVRLREDNSMRAQALCGVYHEYLAVRGGRGGDLSAMAGADRNLYLLCRASARQTVATARGVPLSGVLEA